MNNEIRMYRNETEAARGFVAAILRELPRDVGDLAYMAAAEALEDYAAQDWDGTPGLLYSFAWDLFDVVTDHAEYIRPEPYTRTRCLAACLMHSRQLEALRASVLGR